jgi:hypothetical protein
MGGTSGTLAVGKDPTRPPEGAPHAASHRAHPSRGHTTSRPVSRRLCRKPWSGEVYVPPDPPDGGHPPPGPPVGFATAPGQVARAVREPRSPRAAPRPTHPETGTGAGTVPPPPVKRGVRQIGAPRPPMEGHVSGRGKREPAQGMGMAGDVLFGLPSEASRRDELPDEPSTFLSKRGPAVEDSWVSW